MALTMAVDDFEPLRTTGTRKPKVDPLWRTHDMMAQKAGQRGTIYWVGKSIVGEDGMRTGERSAGASYHGEWHDNRKQGYGVQEFPNGEKYEGQWGNGLRNGEGTLWVPVGKAKKLRKLYVGGWQDDKRHGRGTCFFKNGEFFQGSWDRGKMHGQGTLRYSNGDLYIGEWYQGQRSGQGTLNKANGDCYEGYWLNDKREGSGSHFYSESGKVFVGEWANDLPKAGVYTQANPNPEQATSVPTTSVLPTIRLALPTDVLEGALAAVRNARKCFRARNTPLSRLFAEDEVAALREAFTVAARAATGMDGQPLSGSANVVLGADVQELCAQLGTEVTGPRLRRLMTDAGAIPIDAPAGAEHELSVRFEEFLRVVALLLDEEAAEPASEMPIAGTHDFWDEDGLFHGDEEEDILDEAMRS